MVAISVTKSDLSPFWIIDIWNVENNFTSIHATCKKVLSTQIFSTQTSSIQILVNQTPRTFYNKIWFISPLIKTTAFCNLIGDVFFLI